MTFLSRHRWLFVGLIGGIVVTLPIFLSPLGLLIMVVAPCVGAGADGKRHKAEGEAAKATSVEARMRELEAEEAKTSES